MHPAQEVAFTADLQPEVTAKPRAPRIASYRRKRHARTILAHIDAAKARKSGKDMSGMTAAELIADLLAYRVGV